MRKPISLSIFFPAYNEEENIRAAVEKTIRVVEDSPFVSDYEILIINDGSTDRTGDIAQHLAETYPTVRLINHERNMGYGAALKTGIASATKEYVFFTDADLQFDLLELQNLLIHIEENDVVIGYRAPRRDPFLRLVNAWGWNTLNRLLFGLRIKDIDCAFKLFKRSDIQRLRLRSRGAMISAETLIRLARSGARIKEIPVSHLPRLYGSPTGAKPAVILRAFREMVSLYQGELGLVTHKEVLKFMAVGVVNTLLDAAAFIFLTRWSIFIGEPVAAKFFSFLLGTVSSLFLNRYWTFGIRTKVTLREVGRFYATVSASLLINVSLMYVLVHTLGVYDLVAFGAVTVFNFVFNYTLSKMWVFKQESVSKLARQNQL